MGRILRFAPSLILLLAAVNAAIANAAEPIAKTTSPGYRVIKKIAPGGEGGWDYLTIDSAARRLYIARSNRVMVFDVDKGSQIGEIPDTPGVHGVAIIPKLGHGFSSDGGDNTVTVFDLKTLKTVDKIKVGTRPDNILYDPQSARLFTFNSGSADATAVDPAKQIVVGTIPLGGKPEAAVADGKGHVFVNIENKDEIVELDARKLEIVRRLPIAPGKEPSGLAIDLMHRRLFCTCRNKQMIVLGADDGQVLATLPIGDHTDACVFDPLTRLAFSSNGDGTVTVVRAGEHDDFDVVQTIITQNGARTMALDPMTHNLFLVTAIPKPGEKRVYEPGTFVIIVVAMPEKKGSHTRQPLRPLAPPNSLPGQVSPTKPLPGQATPNAPPGQP